MYLRLNKSVGLLEATKDTEGVGSVGKDVTVVKQSHSWCFITKRCLIFVRLLKIDLEMDIRWLRRS